MNKFLKLILEFYRIIDLLGLIHHRPIGNLEKVTISKLVDKQEELVKHYLLSVFLVIPQINVAKNINSQSEINKLRKDSIARKFVELWSTQQELYLFEEAFEDAKKISKSKYNLELTECLKDWVSLSIFDGKLKQPKIDIAPTPFLRSFLLGLKRAFYSLLHLKMQGINDNGSVFEAINDIREEISHPAEYLYKLTDICKEGVTKFRNIDFKTLSQGILAENLLHYLYRSGELVIFTDIGVLKPDYSGESISQMEHEENLTKKLSQVTFKDDTLDALESSTRKSVYQVFLDKGEVPTKTTYKIRKAGVILSPPGEYPKKDVIEDDLIFYNEKVQNDESKTDSNSNGNIPETSKNKAQESQKTSNEEKKSSELLLRSKPTQSDFIMYKTHERIGCENFQLSFKMDVRYLVSIVKAYIENPELCDHLYTLIHNDRQYWQYVDKMIVFPNIIASMYSLGLDKETNNVDILKDIESKIKNKLETSDVLSQLDDKLDKISSAQADLDMMLASFCSRLNEKGVLSSNAFAEIRSIDNKESAEGILEMKNQIDVAQGKVDAMIDRRLYSSAIYAIHICVLQVQSLLCCLLAQTR
ncbi:hypothetical protein QAD02_018593 [Eretmocerus hayati]|uniref:Uncharacterized protein n=1 Tax=Eretmocerus hayati TaxID=131215 RepID=A0ACC2PIF0_9HYME|nr:hypothetical protein QAD02_018593 [Eretmocerus hayati]